MSRYKELARELANEMKLPSSIPVSFRFRGSFHIESLSGSTISTRFTLVALRLASGLFSLAARLIDSLARCRAAIKASSYLFSLQISHSFSPGLPSSQ